MVALVTMIVGTPLRHWVDRASLRFKLRTEYEYEERKKLRVLIGSYRGQMLEVAERLDHRFWNLYKNHQAGWHNVKGNYSNVSGNYYYTSWLYRFGALIAVARKFEREAVFIDSRYAIRSDLTFVKFLKGFFWVFTDVALFDEQGYDPYRAVDHFFSDDLRKFADSLITDKGLLTYEQFQDVVKKGAVPTSIFQFFDGVTRGEQRNRWDRLVCAHLFVLAFLANFGYDMQAPRRRRFKEVASYVENPLCLLYLRRWIPKLGLDDNKAGGWIRALTWRWEFALTRDRLIRSMKTRLFRRQALQT